MSTAPRPCVLVVSGLDPSGGAGIAADLAAISAQGAHPLPLISTLTVQDNNRVYGLEPVATDLLQRQLQVLLQGFRIAAVKLGIIGSVANAQMLAELLLQLRRRQPGLAVVLDPVLASGHGDQLAQQDALAVLQPLLSCATLITPNLPELARLSGAAELPPEQQIQPLRQRWPELNADVLIKGGHAAEGMVRNCWYPAGQTNSRREWLWPRLDGAFHGSGCTLAAALAGQLALGRSTETALELAQGYTQQSLQQAYRIADGQSIPNRIMI